MMGLVNKSPTLGMTVTGNGAENASGQLYEPVTTLRR